MKNLLTIILSLLISSSAIFAQQGRGQMPSGKITGSISDSVSGNAMAYATVTVINPQNGMTVTGAITNQNGRFTVDPAPFGNFDIEFSFLGYEKTKIEGIEINGKQRSVDVGSVKLIPSSIMQDEVEVVAEKDYIRYEIDKKVVDVGKDLAAQGGTAADALKNVPSVSVDSDGKVSLRGSQNFRLLVDGKPSMLSVDQLLQQIPAAAIDNIEIITNPSAKYSPEGESGIINIVMKKQSYNGVSSLTSITTGTRDKYNGSGIFNYKNGSYSTYFGLDFHDRKFFPKSEYSRINRYGDSVSNISPYINRTMNSSGYNAKAGLDLNISGSQALSFELSGGHFGFRRYFPSNFTNSLSYGNNTDYEYYRNNDDFDMSGDYLALSTNYKLDFENPGHNLNINLSGHTWKGGLDNSSQRYEANSGDFKEWGDLLSGRLNDTDADYLNGRLKVDYTRPFGEKSKLELGTESVFAGKNSNYRMEDFDTGTGEWYEVTEFTNEADFMETTQALYATYSSELLGVGLMLGLRGEYYYRNFEQLTTEDNFDFDKFDLFPTLHMSKQLGERNQLQFGFSRRIQRPDDRLLNPFPDYADDYTVSYGNPALKPHYTNSLELNYRRTIGKRSFISLESYYRNSTDIISRKFSMRDDGRLLLTHDNINEDFIYGGEVAGNFTFADWLSVYAGVNFYNYTLKDFTFGQNVEQSADITDFNLRATSYLSKSTMLQVTGFYQGPRLVADGRREEYYAVNASVRQELMGGKLALTLSMQDIFDTGEVNFSTIGPDFESYGYMKPESQVVSLTISYNFNQFRQTKKDNTPDLNFGGGM